MELTQYLVPAFGRHALTRWSELCKDVVEAGDPVCGEVYSFGGGVKIPPQDPLPSGPVVVNFEHLLYQCMILPPMDRIGCVECAEHVINRLEGGVEVLALLWIGLRH